MTQTFSILDNLRIASPCSANWDAMTGDDRTRFCGSCHKHVYNIASMSAQDVVTLIQEREGNVCARLYRRADGTVLTSDCPVGAREVWRSTRRLVAAISLAAAVGIGGILLPSLVHGKSTTPSDGAPVIRRATILWDDLLVWMGFRTRMIPMGDICVLPPPAVPSTGAATDPAEQ